MPRRHPLFEIDEIELGPWGSMPIKPSVRWSGSTAEAKLSYYTHLNLARRSLEETLVRLDCLRSCLGDLKRFFMAGAKELGYDFYRGAFNNWLEVDYDYQKLAWQVYQFLDLSISHHDVEKAIDRLVKNKQRTYEKVLAIASQLPDGECRNIIVRPAEEILSALAAYAYDNIINPPNSLSEIHDLHTKSIAEKTANSKWQKVKDRYDGRCPSLLAEISNTSVCEGVVFGIAQQINTPGQDLSALTEEWLIAQKRIVALSFEQGLSREYKTIMLLLFVGVIVQGYFAEPKSPRVVVAHALQFVSALYLAGFKPVLAQMGYGLINMFPAPVRRESVGAQEPPPSQEQRILLQFEMCKRACLAQPSSGMEHRYPFRKTAAILATVGKVVSIQQFLEDFGVNTDYLSLGPVWKYFFHVPIALFVAAVGLINVYRFAMSLLIGVFEGAILGSINAWGYCGSSLLSQHRKSEEQTLNFVSALVGLPVHIIVALLVSLVRFVLNIGVAIPSGLFSWDSAKKGYAFKGFLEKNWHYFLTHDPLVCKSASDELEPEQPGQLSCSVLNSVRAISQVPANLLGEITRFIPYCIGGAAGASVVSVQYICLRLTTVPPFLDWGWQKSVAGPMIRLQQCGPQMNQAAWQVGQFFQLFIDALWFGVTPLKTTTRLEYRLACELKKCLNIFQADVRIQDELDQVEQGVEGFLQSNNSASQISSTGPSFHTVASSIPSFGSGVVSEPAGEEGDVIDSEPANLGETTAALVAANADGSLDTVSLTSRPGGQNTLARLTSLINESLEIKTINALNARNKLRAKRAELSAHSALSQSVRYDLRGGVDKLNLLREDSSPAANVESLLPGQQAVLSFSLLAGRLADDVGRYFRRNTEVTQDAITSLNRDINNPQLIWLPTRFRKGFLSLVVFSLIGSVPLYFSLREAVSSEDGEDVLAKKRNLAIATAGVSFVASGLLSSQGVLRLILQAVMDGAINTNFLPTAEPGGRGNDCWAKIARLSGQRKSFQRECPRVSYLSQAFDGLLNVLTMLSIAATTLCLYNLLAKEDPGFDKINKKELIISGSALLTSLLGLFNVLRLIPLVINILEIACKSYLVGANYYANSSIALLKQAKTHEVSKYIVGPGLKPLGGLGFACRSSFDMLGHQIGRISACCLQWPILPALYNILLSLQKVLPTFRPTWYGLFFLKGRSLGWTYYRDLKTNLQMQSYQVAIEAFVGVEITQADRLVRRLPVLEPLDVGAGLGGSAAHDAESPTDHADTGHQSSSTADLEAAGSQVDVGRQLTALRQRLFEEQDSSCWPTLQVHADALKKREFFLRVEALQALLLKVDRYAKQAARQCGDNSSAGGSWSDRPFWVYLCEAAVLSGLPAWGLYVLTALRSKNTDSEPTIDYFALGSSVLLPLVIQMVGMSRLFNIISGDWSRATDAAPTAFLRENVWRMVPAVGRGLFLSAFVELLQKMIAINFFKTLSKEITPEMSSGILGIGLAIVSTIGLYKISTTLWQLLMHLGESLKVLLQGVGGGLYKGSRLGWQLYNHAASTSFNEGMQGRPRYTCIAKGVGYPASVLSMLVRFVLSSLRGIYEGLFNFTSSKLALDNVFDLLCCSLCINLENNELETDSLELSPANYVQFWKDEYDKSFYNPESEDCYFSKNLQSFHAICCACCYRPSILANLILITLVKSCFDLLFLPFETMSPAFSRWFFWQNPSWQSSFHNKTLLSRTIMLLTIVYTICLLGVSAYKHENPRNVFQDASSSMKILGGFSVVETALILASILLPYLARIIIANLRLDILVKAMVDSFNWRFYFSSTQQSIGAAWGKKDPAIIQPLLSIPLAIPAAIVGGIKKISDNPALLSLIPYVILFIAIKLIYATPIPNACDLIKDIGSLGFSAKTDSGNGILRHYGHQAGQGIGFDIALLAGVYICISALFAKFDHDLQHQPVLGLVISGVALTLFSNLAGVFRHKVGIDSMNQVRGQAYIENAQYIVPQGNQRQCLQETLKAAEGGKLKCDAAGNLQESNSCMADKKTVNLVAWYLLVINKGESTDGARWKHPISCCKKTSSLAAGQFVFTSQGDYLDCRTAQSASC